SPLPLVTGLVDRQAQLAAEMLATIYAGPQVLEHRLVWADALTGRGDPRGEFIQLQFARPSGQKPGKREKQLLAEHELAWLGELITLVDRDSVRWAHGFPIRAAVVFDSQAQRELIASPMWATFEELDCDDLELITSPSLRSLRRVGRLSTTTLVALAEARGPALAIERLGPVGLPQNPPAELDRLRAAEAERLVEVRELRLHLRDRMASKRPDDFDWLFATALGRRLTSIRLSAMTLVNEETSHVPWSQWAAARTRWPKIERLRVDAGVISVEMCDRQLIVRTLQSDDPIPYY